MPDDELNGTPQNCGVINPYALAEYLVGKSIDWSAVRSVPELLEDILQTPYDELFDPVHQGPLYTGLELDDALKLKLVRSPLLDLVVDTTGNDLELDFDRGRDLRFLRDVASWLDGSDLGDIPVQRVRTTADGRIEVTMRLPSGESLRRLRTVLRPEIVRAIAFDPETAGNTTDWTPPNGQWATTGDFYNEAAEFFDPQQGAVANCYYIAALGAVAWATPYQIAHVSRATGLSNLAFTDRISFFQPDSGGVLDREVEVTERLPLTLSGSFIYCRSTESGESWPAIYEKAYAKLKTGITGDQPDIVATAWGDCVWATAQLNGGRRSYWNTVGRTGDQMWDLVRANSLSGRTFRPMTAWTYSTGDASEKKVVYDGSNVVASHCYTVLGWDYRDGLKYIVLRNPWGRTEPTVGVLSGTSSFYDISWWRPIALAPDDGTFGVEAGVFQTYFAGLGLAS